MRAICLATFLFAQGTAAASAIDVALFNLSQVYDGYPKIPDVTTNPGGLPTALSYRNLTNPQPPVSGLVFNNIPSTLALSYSSVPFHSQSITGVGNYLALGGVSRKLASVDVVMVTWAKALDYPALAATDPNGYTHPVKLTIYQVTDTRQLVFLTEVERSIFVPWRPLALPSGDPYPENGLAFVASFDFANGITLPDKVMAMVSFNTQQAGFTPLNTAGPYNQLNVAIQSSAILPSIGSDADPGEFLKIVRNSSTASNDWYYPDTTLSTRSFLMGVRALSTQTKVAPVNAGTYEVTASMSDSTFVPAVLGSLLIEKAPAAIQIQSSLFYTGSPVPAQIATNPTDLDLDVSYDGSPTPPSSLGPHNVEVQVNDPNYYGTLAGQYTLSPSFKSWIEEQIDSVGLPQDQAGDAHDPDHDGIPNLTEYALNLNPMSAFGSETGPLPLLPGLALKNGSWTFSYRRNVNAADCSFAIECQEDPGQPAPWPTVTGTEQVLSDDGQTRLIEVTLPVAVGTRQFYRLRIQR